MKKATRLLFMCESTFNRLGADFKKWFGSSKVLATPKRPMLLFRGISINVEERHPSAKLGIFATPKKDIAKTYGSGKLLQVYMKIENPYYMSFDEIQSLDTEDKALKKKKDLIRKGYDGVFLKAIEGSGTLPGEITEYVAFEKSQIKFVDDI